MQTLLIAVQNTVPAKDMGVATSSATFFRQMGGTLGVAVFLSLLFNSLPDKIQSAFQSAAGNPAFLQAVGAAAQDPNSPSHGVATGADAGPVQPGRRFVHRRRAEQRLVVPEHPGSGDRPALPGGLRSVHPAGVHHRRDHHDRRVRAGAVDEGAAAAHPVRDRGAAGRAGRTGSTTETAEPALVSTSGEAIATDGAAPDGIGAQDGSSDRHAETETDRRRADASAQRSRRRPGSCLGDRR